MRRLVPFGVFALALAAYGATLCPTVPGGDAGELIVVARDLGVAHPPGYPLWTLLAGLFARLPLGSVAARVAWLSAVCSAGAAALIAAAVQQWFDGSDDETQGLAAAGAVVAAALFAFSPTAWAYAVTAEVFPLNSLLVALLLLLALRWERRRDVRTARAVALVTGFGLANHHTLVFVAAPVGAWMLWTGRALLWSPRELALLAGAGLLGLAPYLHLGIAGLRELPSSWGDTATLQGFVDHLLRRDYGTFQLLPSGHPESSSYAAKTGAYLSHFGRASLLAGALLPVAAVAAAWQDRRRGAWPLLVAACALFYVAAFHALANVDVSDLFLRGVLARFWMQADVAGCLLAGVGFVAVASRMPGRRVAASGVLATVAVVAALGASGGARPDRGAGLVERYGRAILEPLPKDALLLTSGDLITNAVRYLQSCEGLRPDVVVLDQEMMTKPWYVRRLAAAHPDVHFPGAVYHPAAPGGFSMRAFLDANRDARPLWLYPDWKSGDSSTAGAYTVWPYGLASEITPATRPLDAPKWMRESGAAVQALDARAWPRLDSAEPGTWERVALEDVWQARHRRAVALLNLAIEANNDPGLLTVARGEFEAAARVHPAPPFHLWKNLGLACERLALTNPQARPAQLDAWRRYLAAAPTSDPDYAAVAQAVKRLEGR